MHTEYLHSEQTFALRPNRVLFSDGGICPNGDSWVEPTEAFLRVWESPAGVHLKKQGFRMRNDGKQIGASADCIILLPRHKG